MVSIYYSVNKNLPYVLLHINLVCIHSINSDPNFLMVLPFINISDTYNFDLVALEATDDGGTGPISIPEEIGFPFGNSSLTTLYVSHCFRYLLFKAFSIFLIDWNKWSDII